LYKKLSDRLTDTAQSSCNGEFDSTGYIEKFFWEGLCTAENRLLLIVLCCDLSPVVLGEILRYFGKAGHRTSYNFLDSSILTC